MFGTKKQFKIFKTQNNTEGENKDSKQSTGGDKGVAICTPTSSKTFISDAMSQNNKKMNGNQTNANTTISTGTNMQVPHILILFRTIQFLKEIKSFDEVYQNVKQ